MGAEEDIRAEFAAKTAELQKTFDRIAGSVGLTTADLMKLFLHDDDWTKLIRCSALIEAALNGYLLRSVTPRSTTRGRSSSASLVI